MSEETQDREMAIATIIDGVGSLLIHDGTNDCGYFSYYNRQKGDPHTGYGTGRHASPFHNWQIGLGFKIAGYFMGLMSALKSLNSESVHENMGIFTSIVDQAL